MRPSRGCAVLLLLITLLGVVGQEGGGDEDTVEQFPPWLPWTEDSQCENLFLIVAEYALIENGWDYVDPKADSANSGGGGSQIWVKREEGLILKRFTQYLETFDREVFWLKYFEDAGEDIAPKLLAAWSGGDNDERFYLSTHVGELLMPGNAPSDWERQVGDILATLHAHDCRHNDLKQGEFRVGADGRLRVIDFGWASRGPDFTLGGVARARSRKPHGTHSNHYAIGTLRSHLASFVGWPLPPLDTENLGDVHRVGWPEHHLVIVWRGGAPGQVAGVREAVASVEHLELRRVVEMPGFPADYWYPTMRKFYHPTHFEEADMRGRAAFSVCVVRDSAPVYDERKTTQGWRQVNAKLFDLKWKLRNGGFGVHVTDNIAETYENLEVFNLSEMGLIPPVHSRPVRPPAPDDRISSAARGIASSIQDMGAGWRLPIAELFPALTGGWGGFEVFAEAVSLVYFAREVLSSQWGQERLGFGASMVLALRRWSQEADLNVARMRAWDVVEERAQLISDGQLWTCDDALKQGEGSLLVYMFALVVKAGHRKAPPSTLPRLSLPHYVPPSYRDIVATHAALQMGGMRLVVVRPSCLGMCAPGDFVHIADLGIPKRGEEVVWRALEGLAGKGEGSLMGTDQAGTGGVAVLIGGWATGCFEKMSRKSECSAVWSDDRKGVEDLANIVFNENGRKFLRVATRVALDKSQKRLDLDVWKKSAARVQGVARAARIPGWTLCAVKGAVLEILGLRRATDLDLVVLGDFEEKAIDATSNESSLVTIERSENNLVASPMQHFVLFGAKFASVTEVWRRKGEKGVGTKDLLDLIELDTYIREPSEFDPGSAEGQNGVNVDASHPRDVMPEGHTYGQNQAEDADGVVVLTVVSTSVKMLEWQEAGFRKHMAERINAYIVVINTISGIDAEVWDVCSRLAVECLQAPPPDGSDDGSASDDHGRVLEWAWSEVILRRFAGSLVFVTEQDMFPIRPFSARSMVAGCDVAGARQTRVNELGFEVEYLHPCALVVETASLPLPETMRFRPCAFNGTQLDTGGGLAWYFQAVREEGMAIRVCHLPVKSAPLEPCSDIDLLGSSDTLSGSLLHLQRSSGWEIQHAETAEKAETLRRQHARRMECLEDLLVDAR